MFYPTSPCCPECNEDNRMYSCPSDSTKTELLKNICRLKFSAYDLQLFLDTHPYDEKALELFTQICASLDSATMDYEAKYGPLKAFSSKNAVPFQWVAEDYNWPWVKEGEK